MFIINTTIHQTTTDTQILKPHLEQFEQLYNTKPEVICADTGYGSEENYQHLEEQHIDTYVRNNHFHKEQSKKWRNDPFRSGNLYYNEATDTCPMGQAIHKTGEQKTKDQLS